VHRGQGVEEVGPDKGNLWEGQSITKEGQQNLENGKGYQTEKAETELALKNFTRREQKPVCRDKKNGGKVHVN